MSDEGFAERRACAICGRVLQYNRIVSDYEHAIADAPADHPCVPVAVEEIPEQLRARCDFCQDEVPTHVLPVRPFLMPSMPDHASIDGWAACEPCSALLERNEWSALVRRVRTSYETRHGAPMTPIVESHLRALFREVRRNVCGALRKT